MPVVGRDPIDDAVADLRARAEKAGRDPAAVGVTLFGARPDEAKLAAWRDLGVERVLLPLPPAGRDGAPAARSLRVGGGQDGLSCSPVAAGRRPKPGIERVGDGQECGTGSGCCGSYAQQ